VGASGLHSAMRFACCIADSRLTGRCNKRIVTHVYQGILEAVASEPAEYFAAGTSPAKGRRR